MRELLSDRLTGRTANRMSGPLILGRWQVCRTEPMPLVMNEAQVSPGDYLVPGTRGAFALHGGEIEVRDEFQATQLPPELDAGSIINMGQILDAMAGSHWSEWLAIPPLVPGMSERAQLRTFEYDMIAHLPALESVCRRPRTHLAVQVERIAAARARRLPQQALSHLASHTEDWEHATLRGVRPRRVLALVPEEQLDIYENRIAARLIDYLHAYLIRRIHELQRLYRMFLQASEYGETAAAGSHWRQSRIFSLWGRSMDAGQGVQKSLRTLRKLEELQLKVAGLKDSALYRGVSRRAYVGSTLTQTNILASDALYARVARLWLLWARHGHPQPRTATKVYDDGQALCRGFVSFVVLLLLHAFSQLRYSPDEDDKTKPIAPGAAIGLQGPDGRFRLVWETDDTLHLLTVSGTRLLHIVPLPAMLEGLLVEQPAHVSAVFELVTADTLVLYPAAPEATETAHASSGLARIRTVGNDLAQKEAGAGCISVSPWDIASAERVARALRWVLLGPRIKAYPPRVERSPSLRFEGGTWLATSMDTKTWTVLRPPRADEWTRFGLVQAQEEAEQRLATLVQSRDVIQQDLRARRDVKRERSALNREKRVQTKELGDQEAATLELTRCRKSLEAAVQSIKELLICPICKQEETEPYHRFQAREGTFVCKCTSCSSAWGQLTCFRCRQGIPFLWPAGIELPSLQSSMRQPGWVDAYVGCDLLAVPCPRAPGPEPKYLCPSCGACPCCQK